MTIQLKVVKSAMHALAEGCASGSLESLGLLTSDLKLVTSNLPWKAAERNTVVRTMDTLMYGTMDALALPRFEVPAEYVAAAIAMFVKPCNIQPACIWLESSGLSALQMANPSTNQTRIEANQLFALVLQLSDDSEVGEIRHLFEQRTQYQITQAIRQGVKSNEKQT